MKKWIKRIFFGLLAVFLAMQFVPEDRLLWLMVMAIGAPLVFGIMGIQTLIQSSRWLKNAKSAQGTIVDSEVVMLGKNRKRPFYRQVIEFCAEDGKAHRFSAKAIYAKPPEATNSPPLPVLYQANNPDDARLDTPQERPRPFLILFWAVLLTILGGIYCSYYFQADVVLFFFSILAWVVAAYLCSPKLGRIITMPAQRWGLRLFAFALAVGITYAYLNIIGFFASLA